MTTNTLPLTRPMLETLLKYLCDQLSDPGSPYHIPGPLLLVIHGGAAMLLHPSYQTIPTSRQSTLDVDYLATPLSSAARTTLTRAITETSRAFPGLGADWMNADADVALPPGVWEGSTHAGNLLQNSIFERGHVRLVSVSPGWAVGLKLMRYEKYDAGDVVVILLNGLRMKGGGKWTREIVEGWVRAECATMGYAAWPAWKLAEMRVRIGDAVRLVEEWLREHPGVVTKTIVKQASVMSVQEEAEIREWERRLKRGKERGEKGKPRGRYLLGQWVEPDDSDSDSDSDTSTESDESPTPPLSTASSESYYPPDQHQPSCPYSAPPTLTSPYTPYQPPPLTSHTRASSYQPPPHASPYQQPHQRTVQTQTSSYQLPPLTSPYQPPNQHQSQTQPSPYQPPHQSLYSPPRSQSSPYQAPNNSPLAQGYIPPADFSPPPPSKTPAPHMYATPPQPPSFAAPHMYPAPPQPPSFTSPIYASPNPGALLSPLNHNMSIPFSTPWIGANMVGARAGW
ncbi:hypothetical protein F5146DRAFT_1059575 [Armillaria mellea]|nr:hypothetical protein F5146DRAFT_1059575 [Armillaria mellea]